MNAFIAALAFLVALAPFRQAQRLRDLGRSHVLGAVAALLVVISIVAAVSGPLLSAMDVSGPTARIGAGLVVAITSLVRLLRPVLRAEESTLDIDPGWTSALIPAAFPVLLQPVVALVALSAGADRGWLQTVVLAAPAALVWAIATMMSGSKKPAPSSWHLRVRSVASVGLFVGATLMVDGVFAL